MAGLSIITINYNNKRGLEKTFASVFNQGFTDFEYFVIDGGSTDGSTGLITQNASKITRWICEKDNGIYDAMNKAISLANGAYLIFLNSGDCFCSPDTLECCINYLSDFPGTDIFYADIYLVHDYNQANKELYTHPAELTLAYLKENIPNHQASLVSTKLFKEFGLYPAQYKLAGDYWLYLKSFLTGKKFRFMNFVMVDFDTTGLTFTAADSCIAEMNIVWDDLVPLYAQQLLMENQALNKKLKYKLVGAAIQINTTYQRVKKFFK